ncbi:putative Fic/DOC [Desulfovibrio sp. X2]|uniref:Fic family protein n=1 Tax=Desulfovibrio sp. X2 TaxID=941449 RepID=UPI000358C75B|nr:Fic/DOC family N-terminal domain-containing protein [Desulfovibrio sp. X2]EPR40475.1 putative Fic/DOC [Desulfovibrio sp. X2]
MRPFIPQRLPITEIEWERLIPSIGKANRALALYDGLLQGIPEPAVLLSPLTTQEAVLSSKIEGTQATLGEVLKFDAGESPKEEERRRDIGEIVNYRRALFYAQSTLADRAFTLSLLKELHAILLDSVRGENKQPGLFRTTQNWIGPSGTPMEQALFVPPEPILLPEYLENWEEYYHRERPDPFVQLAVLHAQFEILHPFNDGNGRLGRMLVPLFLFERKILSSPMFYLSSYLEKHRDRYVAALRQLGVEQGAWNAWIEFFLTAISEQAGINTDKVRAIMSLYAELKERVLRLTHSQYAVPLLDRLFARPIFQAAQLATDPAMPSRPMISNLLGKLKQDGILSVLSPGSGRRGETLILSGLVNLCEGKALF